MLSALLSLMLSVSPAWSNDLTVSVTKQNRKVTIHYETATPQNSMCGMYAFRVVMDGGVATTPDKRVKGGMLQIETEVPSGINCLMAIGPHSGQEVFSVGDTFPKLRRGTYQLWINGEDYGEMNVKVGSVSLTP
jgi:hypothetical protein